MATTERRAASAALSARTLWSAALLVAAGYGVFLIVVAMRVPAGAELTGQFGLQPAVKAAAASFVLGLAAFLIAHLCFLAALLPLARSTPPSRPRLAAVAVMVVAVPVTVYIAVLGAWCAPRCWLGCRPRGRRWVRCASQSRTR